MGLESGEILALPSRPRVMTFKDILSVVPPNPDQLTIVAEDGALAVWIDTTIPGTFALYAL